MPDNSTARLYFRITRTEYTEIEVDVLGLLAEWGDMRADFPGDDEEFVHETLWRIGVQDLTYSGDFVRVLETDNDESIEPSPGPRAERLAPEVPAS